MTEQEFTIEELANEEWREIQITNGYHSISNLGRIRRDKSGSNAIVGKILKIKPNKYGYFKVNLSANGERFDALKVHQLVARAFLGKTPEGKTVNHEDGVKTNNRSSNLNFKTHKEQMEHAKKLGLVSSGDRHMSRTHPERLARGDNHFRRRCPELVLRGEKAPRAKLKDSDIPLIFLFLAAGWTQAEIARKYNINGVSVWKILHGKAYAHITLI